MQAALGVERGREEGLALDRDHESKNLIFFFFHRGNKLRSNKRSSTSNTSFYVFPLVGLKFLGNRIVRQERKTRLVPRFENRIYFFSWRFSTRTAQLQSCVSRVSQYGGSIGPRFIYERKEVTNQVSVRKTTLQTISMSDASNNYASINVCR